MGLKSRFKKWVVKQGQKDRCGVWPFQLPRWSPFTASCRVHDSIYTVTRADAVAKALQEKVDIRADSAWLHINYRAKILEGDGIFYDSMDVEASEKSYIAKKVMGQLAKIFTLFVSSYGWSIWEKNTLEEWDNEVAKSIH